MSHLEESPDRPEFATIDLDLPIEDAHGEIDETIAGLYASETEEGLKVRTVNGILVATLEKHSAGSGDAKSALAYRTEPELVPATRKARKIRDALAPHEIDE